MGAKARHQPHREDSTATNDASGVFSYPRTLLMRFRDSFDPSQANMVSSGARDRKSRLIEDEGRRRLGSKLLGIGGAKSRGNLYHRCRGIQDGTSILGERWINPLAVDRLLGSLGRFTNRSDSSIPSLRVNCSPRTKVQNS